ncbi:uracil-DNA glycosylase family protein, partial [Bacteroidota bacterium]
MEVTRYQQKCYHEYNKSIGLPDNYNFPYGNPIRPLPPYNTHKKNIMIVGAYPSARFEKVKSGENLSKYRLVPVGNNLHPFANEDYFDGIRMRASLSDKELREYLLDPLGLEVSKCWITNLVKVFLYRNTHKESCNEVFPGFDVPVLRNKFKDLGRKSIKWIQEEIKICKPKLIITLGHEVANIVSGKKFSRAEKVLKIEINNPPLFNNINSVHMPHPDICRRSDKFRD